ncbi:MAG: acid phosphatase [Akkermansiaceae bacterium]|nr:acid phosphatase [Akkermansiaceae bacterium]
MSSNHPISRRRLIKTLFCSSVAMNLNLSAHAAEEKVMTESVLDLLALGDFGSGTEAQLEVACSLAHYGGGMKRKADGLFLLGDNFYGPMPGGVKSERWKTGFSDLYPAKNFPGPCWAVLGNHDYTDTPGNEQAQLNYAASMDGKTRWTMPAKYYRIDLPTQNPQVTFLMIDTNFKSINGRLIEEGHLSDSHEFWISEADRAAQAKWLEDQLSSPRAPFTIVVGHHPVYSEGSHGDTPELIEQIAPLLEKYKVHLYLCGHDHDLQHLELEGLKTSFVVSGGGGAGIRKPKDEIRKGSNFYGVHGFTHLFLAGDRLHVRHIDTNQKQVHAFSKGVNHDWQPEV